MRNCSAPLAIDFPGRVGVKIAYDNALAHLVEAGSDTVPDALRATNRVD